MLGLLGGIIWLICMFALFCSIADIDDTIKGKGKKKR